MNVKKLLRNPIKNTLIVIAVSLLVLVGTRMAQLSLTRIDVAKCEDKSKCYPAKDFASISTRQILYDFNLVSRIVLEASTLFILAQLALRIIDKRS